MPILRKVKGVKTRWVTYTDYLIIWYQFKQFKPPALRIGTAAIERHIHGG